MKLFQQMVVPLLLLQLAYLGIGIIHVAKDQCAGWTGLDTCRLDFSVFEWAVLQLGLQFFLLDPLHTEATLLHDPTLSYGHIRIQHQSRKVAVLVKIELVVFDVFKPVEPANTVWTVVDAILGPYAAHIGHLIQSLVAMHGGRNGTNILTGSIVAMLAHNRLVKHPGILRILTEIPVNTHPVHNPPVLHLFLAHSGHIVLRCTGHHTVVTTCTFILIHNQAPMVPVKFDLGIEGLMLCFRLQVEMIAC